MTEETVVLQVEELEGWVQSGRDYEQAETTARNLLEFLSQSENSSRLILELQCRTLLALSNSLHFRGLAQEALAAATNGFAIAQDLHNKVLQAKACNTMGLVHWNLSDNAIALEYFEKACALHEELGDKHGIATATGNIGLVHSNLADFQKSLEHLSAALALCVEVGDQRGMARNTGNIGIVYSELADYTRALEFYEKALALNESLQNTRGVARNIGHIGLVYENLSDYQRALECFLKARALHEEIGDRGGVAINTSNIGHLYMNISDYTNALEYMKKALELVEELGDTKRVALLTGNIGIVYMHLTDFSLALENYAKALSLSKEIGSQRGIASNMSNIGIVYANADFEGYDFNAAEEHLLEALSLCEELGTKKEQYEIHKELSHLFEQRRSQESLEHYRKYHDLYVEVRNEEAMRKAQLMEHRRKIDEAERDRQLKIARHEVTVNLLHKTLPPSIAERLMNGEKNIADKFECVSILFADIVGFTELSARTEPKHLVELLNKFFTRLDQLTVEYGVERVKTIGDAYMVVAGAPLVCDDHALRIAYFAFALLKEAERFRNEIGENIRLRVGINCGEVVAAVIGETKFCYDLWSDAVNIASRMESYGVPGRIHCSESYLHQLSRWIALDSAEIRVIDHDEIDIKGKGNMKTYFIERVV